MSDQPPSDSPRERRTIIERQILQHLCAGTISSPEVFELKEKLAAYSWCDSDNRVVFESLCRLRNASMLAPSELREQLPAQATRMGFPDVKWENYFGQNRSGQRGVLDLVDELLAAK